MLLKTIAAPFAGSARSVLKTRSRSRNSSTSKRSAVVAFISDRRLRIRGFRHGIPGVTVYRTLPPGFHLRPAHRRPIRDLRHERSSERFPECDEIVTDGGPLSVPRLERAVDRRSGA